MITAIASVIAFILGILTHSLMQPKKPTVRAYIEDIETKGKDFIQKMKI